MQTAVINRVQAVTAVTAVIFVALGLANVAMGFYVAEADDAPGAGGIGILLLAAGILLARRAARNRLPRWAALTALAAGLIITAFAVDLTRVVAAAVPLFPQPQEVPSVVDVAPVERVERVERARELVRAAILAQNLPGLSVAVSSGDTLT